MNFLAYDITFLLIFCAFLIIFLVIGRKNLKREGILILYRTKLGIKLIDYIARKYRNFLHSFEYVLIFTGYILMIAMIILLIQLLSLFFNPVFVKAVKIPPIAPLIPYFTSIFNADYLPSFYFTYWIVVLGITAIFHEFFHGIFARARGIKIKSTGFAFLGPFTAAFVEPDEEQVKKLGIKEQLGFLSAGTFANLILAILFFIMLVVFFILAYAPSGAIFNTYAYSVINSSQIAGFGDNLFVNFDGGLNLTEISAGGKTYYITQEVLQNLKNLSSIPAYDNSPALRAGLAGIIIEIDGKKIADNPSLGRIMAGKKPGDKIEIKTLFNNSAKDYEIMLAERPDDKNRAYLGIAALQLNSNSIFGKVRNKILFFKDANTYYKPKLAEGLVIFVYNLIWWLLFINLSVALSNMLPVGIFDGGRVFFLTVLSLTKSEKIAKKAFKISTYFFLFLFLFLTYLWVSNFFR